MPQQDKFEATVARLIAANHAQEQLPPQDWILPQNYASAMAVQARVVQGLGTDIGGWKLGFDKNGHAIAGPMLASHMHEGPTHLRLPRQRVLVEVEIAFRLQGDLPPRKKPYLRAQVLANVSEVLVGIELLHPRLGEEAAENFPLWLADRLGNWGYVAGAGIQNFAALDLAALSCTLQADGAIVHERIGGHPQGDPVAPLLAYANSQNDQLGGLKAGQIITTGSLTPPFYYDSPVQLIGQIGGIGTAELVLSA